MTISRRSFLKGSAAVGGGLIAGELARESLETAAETSSPGMVEDSVPTCCWIGKQDCGLLARRINGQVVKFEGIEGNSGVSTCASGAGDRSGRDVFVCCRGC